MDQRGSQRPVITAGEADQAGSMLLEFMLANRAFAFLCAQLHFGNQVAEVLVAGAGRDEQRKAEEMQR